MRLSSYFFPAPLILGSLSQAMTLETPLDGGLEKRQIAPLPGGPCQPGGLPVCGYYRNNLVSQIRS